MSGGIEVTGGVGGTSALLEELESVVRGLRAAADLLDDAAASVRWAGTQGLGAPHGPPTTRERAREAVAPLAAGPGSLPHHADAARALASAVARASAEYRDADAAAAAVVRTLIAVVGHEAGQRPLLAVLGGLLARALVPPALLAGGVAVMTGRGPALHRFLLATERAEYAVQLLAGSTRGAAPGRTAPSLRPVVGASLRVTATTTLGARAVPALGRRPLQVVPRLGATRTGPAPRGAADLLRDIGRLSPLAGGAAGTVGVVRLDHPDGTRGWAVTIPGTQTLSIGTGPNPMDMATNVRAMAGTADDVSQIVTRALEQAGARPDEPVLLAGHSQGGLVAVALAASPAFTQRHPVVAVLTAGSPVATRPLPPRTAALHLEHPQDLVPALDGWRNPDRPHRTTAVRDLAASTSAADRLAARSPGAAHGLEAYVRTARAVTDAGGTSVREWERNAAVVLGGPGTTAVHREFVGTRTPVGGPGPPVAGVLVPDQRVAPGAPGRGTPSAGLSGPGSPR